MSTNTRWPLNRAFGGSEDGGWWYDAGRFTRWCHGTWFTRAAAVTARNASRPVIAAARRGLHSPGSPLCTGWPVVRVEPPTGAGFPKTRPRGA